MIHLPIQLKQELPSFTSNQLPIQPNPEPSSFTHNQSPLIPSQPQTPTQSKPEKSSKYSSSFISVKQEPEYPLSYFEEQQRKEEFVDKYLSVDTLNGDGFISASFSLPDTFPSENGTFSTSTVSPSTISTSSPYGMFSFQHDYSNPIHLPIGPSLYIAIENDQIQSNLYFKRFLQASQRRQLLLQNSKITSLIHRLTPYDYSFIYLSS